MKRKYVLMLTTAMMLSFGVTACGDDAGSQTNEIEQTENEGDESEITIDADEEELTADDDSDETITDDAESDDSQDEDISDDSEIAESPAVSDIYAQIVDAVELNSPMLVSDEYIMNFYGIDVSTLDEYIFSISEMATSAETIIIMKAADEASVSDVEASLQTVIEYKEIELQDYLPDQYDIVHQSEIKSRGQYVWLVISENEAVITAIIEENL